MSSHLIESQSYFAAEILPAPHKGPFPHQLPNKPSPKKFFLKKEEKKRKEQITQTRTSPTPLHRCVITSLYKEPFKQGAYHDLSKVLTLLTEKVCVLFGASCPS